jgi:hypothetical protein
MVRTSAWVIAARGGCTAAATSAGVARPSVVVPGLERSVAAFRRFLTVIRTRARARAAALEKFIATDNPAANVPRQFELQCCKATSRVEGAISTAAAAAQL